MTDAQTEARAIAPLTLEGAIWHYMDEKTVTAYGPWITKADHDAALAAKDAELVEVHQRYVDANEARIDAEARLAEALKALVIAQANLNDIEFLTVDGFLEWRAARRALTGGQEE